MEGRPAPQQGILPEGNFHTFVGLRSMPIP
jgi:hypothetical protein